MLEAQERKCVTPQFVLFVDGTEGNRLDHFEDQNHTGHKICLLTVDASLINTSTSANLLEYGYPKILISLHQPLGLTHPGI